METFTCSSTFSIELWWSLNVLGEYIFEVSRIIYLRELVIVSRTKNHFLQEYLFANLFFSAKTGRSSRKNLCQLSTCHIYETLGETSTFSFIAQQGTPLIQFRPACDIKLRRQVDSQMVINL